MPPIVLVYDVRPSSHCGCGCAPDPTFTTFDFEVAAVRAAGGNITHHDFETDPMAFLVSPISSFVADKGIQRLPAVVVDGKVVLHDRYPTREELAQWAGLSEEQLASLVTIPEETLPMAGHSHPHGHDGEHGDSCGCGGGGGGCGCSGHGH